MPSKRRSNTSRPLRQDLDFYAPMFAMGKTQAYLLSLATPIRPIVLLKPYNQVVEEKLLSNNRQCSQRIPYRRL
ncbi:hypothetical protein Q1695_012226 [Nippostrongylus brasiliensis]|nr:hypothetical protein Q1695_012226 [Nippostrongylus brasiliensis]